MRRRTGDFGRRLHGCNPLHYQVWRIRGVSGDGVDRGTTKFDKQICRCCYVCYDADTAGQGRQYGDIC